MDVSPAHQRTRSNATRPGLWITWRTGQPLGTLPAVTPPFVKNCTLKGAIVLIRSRVERFQARSLGTSLFGPAAAVARAASQAQKIGELHRFTATDVSFMGAHRTPPSSSGFAVRAAQIMSCYRPSRYRSSARRISSYCSFVISPLA